MATIHLKGEVEIRSSDGAEMVLYSRQEQRDLVLLTPDAAEQIVVDMIDCWGPNKEKMRANIEAFRKKRDAANAVNAAKVAHVNKKVKRG